MRKLGIGVLGVGEMGKRHAENLRRLVPHAQLVAVADVDGARAKKVATELEIEHSYASLEAMLEEQDIRAILIATPDNFHAAAVKTAAQAGKDILCEKPLGVDLKSAQDALQAVARAGVRLQVGFMRRYDPAYLAASKRIEAGEIGDLVVFKSIGRDKDMPPLALTSPGSTECCFYNSTIHDFDLARWLSHDEVAEVHSFGTVAIRPEIAEFGDVVAEQVNLRFRRGAIGNIESYAQCLLRLRCAHRDRGLQGIDPDRKPAARLRYLPQAEPWQLRVGGSLPFPLSRCLFGRSYRLRRHHPERPRPARNRRRWPARGRDRSGRREASHQTPCGLAAR